MSQTWVKSWWMHPYTMHVTPYDIASKQWTVDTINRSLMKKATTIHTTHPSWALYGKMSSQRNHNSSPNNLLSSLFSILSNFNRIKSSLNFPSNRTISLISHASKVLLYIIANRIEAHLDRNIPNSQAGFRKGRGTRDQIANLRWLIEKAIERNSKLLLVFICLL